MPFPYDKYPWLNFQELNLAYFIKHFQEIFQQWDQLYHDLLDWKDATDADLAGWKTTVESGISSWETGLLRSMEDWKDETESDISAWEAATLSALNAWKTATTAVFEQIRTEAAASAQAAAGSASSAQTALAGAQAAQAAAEAAAQSISQSAAQIATNTSNISRQSEDINNIQARLYEWYPAAGSAAITAGQTTISRTPIAEIFIEANQPFDLLFSDPDDTIITGTGGTKILTAYYKDNNNNWHSLGNYSVGVKKRRLAPEDITGLAIYKSNGATGNGGTVYVDIEYRTSSSDSSVEYRLNNVIRQSDDAYSGLSDIATKSANLFNTDTFTPRAYLNKSGNVTTAPNYGFTDWIPVNPGDILYYNCGRAYYICAADRFYIIDADAGTNDGAASGEYTVPQGISFVRLTFLLANISNEPVIGRNSLPDYSPYSTWALKDDAGIKNSLAKSSNYQGPAQIATAAESLNADTTLSLTDAPYYLKKRVSVSARLSFSTFGSVLVGKGYMSYRGKWIEIDGTNITPHSYVDSENVGTPIPHGLTITDFLQILMYLDTDGQCYITIGTVTGTFTSTIDYLYEWNYAPFIRTSMPASNVKLSFAADDLRSPLWILGDSYMGVSVLRVGGQLKNLGYLGYCLSSIAGGGAYGSRSLYDELLRMLALTTPSYLVWEIGINGSSSDSIAALSDIIDLCTEKGITLIAAKIPTIPSKITPITAYNTFLESTGIRYIDEYNAVGANQNGSWYPGFQDDDEVHPTTLGAKALAMRFVNDAPELMQYGKI